MRERDEFPEDNDWNDPDEYWYDNGFDSEDDYIKFKFG